MHFLDYFFFFFNKYPRVYFGKSTMRLRMKSKMQIKGHNYPVEEKKKIRFDKKCEMLANPLKTEPTPVGFGGLGMVGIKTVTVPREKKNKKLLPTSPLFSSDIIIIIISLPSQY